MTDLESSQVATGDQTFPMTHQIGVLTITIDLLEQLLGLPMGTGILKVNDSRDDQRTFSVVLKGPAIPESNDGNIPRVVARVYEAARRIEFEKVPA